MAKFDIFRCNIFTVDVDCELGKGWKSKSRINLFSLAHTHRRWWRHVWVNNCCFAYSLAADDQWTRHAHHRRLLFLHQRPSFHFRWKCFDFFLYWSSYDNKDLKDFIIREARFVIDIFHFATFWDQKSKILFSYQNLIYLFRRRCERKFFSSVEDSSKFFHKTFPSTWKLCW